MSNKIVLLLISNVFLICIFMPSFASSQEIKSCSIQKKLMELEVASDGRIGISAINTANNTRIQYRAEEPFPFASTFKVIEVAAVLKKSMVNNHLLQEKMIYKRQDIVAWSPITEKHVADGMTIAELCAASIMYSDNAAANLLTKRLGGLGAITMFARSIGNNAFRLDDLEPALNASPHDLRDTVAPASMSDSLQKLILGRVLAPPQQAQLIGWMKDNTLGDKRIRSGVPAGWVVADKTGSSDDYGVTNDIGIIWPTKCAPIVVSIYFIQNKKDATRCDEVIASATNLLINEFSKTEGMGAAAGCAMGGTHFPKR